MRSRRRWIPAVPVYAGVALLLMARVQIVCAAPGPWVSPPDMAFEGGDMRVSQVFLPRAQSLPSVAAPDGGTAATVPKPPSRGQMGTSAQRLVQELVLALAPYVSTEEILIDTDAQVIHHPRMLAHVAPSTNKSTRGRKSGEKTFDSGCQSERVRARRCGTENG